MGDSPMIFGASMVRALLEDRKTQTRRIVKAGRYAKSLIGHTYSGDVVNYYGDHRLGMRFVHDERGSWDEKKNPNGASDAILPLPYAIGDRLWVRETWTLATGLFGPEKPIYRADEGTERCEGMMWDAGKWKPSIHMPRWASRLTLIITDVRVERVQDISEEDAQAEGCAQTGGLVSGPMEPAEYDGITAAEDFRDLWSDIHGSDAWDANPWVVALTFDVHKGNINA